LRISFKPLSSNHYRANKGAEAYTFSTTAPPPLNIDWPVDLLRWGDLRGPETEFTYPQPRARQPEGSGVPDL